MKKHAPATLRNRGAILTVLRAELPASGTVLEIASGSGEHAIFFADHLPEHVWQPSDVDPDALSSIRAYIAEYSGINVLDPLIVDSLRSAQWGLTSSVDAIVCINMVHVSPWQATEGLFAGAAQCLRDENLPVILYGPYFEEGKQAVASNIRFDEALRQKNPQWGIRHMEQLDAVAALHGFSRSARHEMPANNLSLIYRSE